MMRYSIKPRDQVFLKRYWLLSFAKNICKNIGKNLSAKFSQKLLDHANHTATDGLKTASKKVFQGTTDVNGDLTDNKITRVSRSSPQNSSGTIESKTNE